jgi:di/tricarboxylate transporter
VVQAGQGSPVGLVTAVYFVTTLFNAVVTNNAAVSIFFPIALEVCHNIIMNVDVSTTTKPIITF